MTSAQASVEPLTSGSMISFTLSESFQNDNSDISFISSDGVVFKLPRKTLEVGTGGFPLSEQTYTNPDPNSIQAQEDEKPIPLSESSVVLSVLFKLISPPTTEHHQPWIFDLKPELCFQVAQASEKYVAYSAMNLCATRMYSMPADQAIHCLNHAYAHGYSALANRAANQALGKTIEEVARGLIEPGLLPKFLIYRSQWTKLCLEFNARFKTKCPRNRVFLHDYNMAVFSDVRKATVLPKLGKIDCICDNPCIIQATITAWQQELTAKQMTQFNDIVV